MSQQFNGRWPHAVEWKQFKQGMTTPGITMTFSCAGTRFPTEEPSAAPTEQPTEAPTEQPTEEPMEEPTEACLSLKVEGSKYYNGAYDRAQKKNTVTTMTNGRANTVVT